MRTSLNTEIQIIADESLKNGLLNYDKRHGYRGPIANNSNEDWHLTYLDQKKPYNFLIAKINNIDELENKANIEVLSNKKKVPGILINFKWARKSLSNGYVGPEVNNVSDLLRVGDIIYVSRNKKSSFNLEQVPKINGGLVVMDPYTGRVFALSGGFDFNLSKFNRAIQAKRQPGSSFKPFVYMSALENGLQPNSLILDAPFVVDQGQN